MPVDPIPPSQTSALAANTQSAAQQRDAGTGTNIQAPQPSSRLVDILTQNGLGTKIGLTRNLFTALTKSGLGNRANNAFAQLLKAQSPAQLPSATALADYCAPNQSTASKFLVLQGNTRNQMADHPCIGLIKEFCGKPFVQQAGAGTLNTQETTKTQEVAGYLAKMLLSHEHTLESLPVLLDRRFTPNEILVLVKALPNSADFQDLRVTLAKNLVQRNQLGELASIQMCGQLPNDLKQNMSIRSLVAAAHGADVGTTPDAQINQLIGIYNQTVYYHSLPDAEQLNHYCALAEICGGGTDFDDVHDQLHNNRDFALLAVRTKPDTAVDIPAVFYGDREFLLTAFPSRCGDQRPMERYMMDTKLDSIPGNLADDYEVALGINHSGWTDQSDDEDDPVQMPLNVISNRLKDNPEFMLKVQKLQGNVYLSASAFLAFCSTRLKNNNAFMKAYLTANTNLLDLGLRGTRDFSEICEAMPMGVKRDQAFNLELLRQDFRYMPYVSSALRDSPNFMLEAIQIEPAAIHWAGHNLPDYIKQTAQTKPAPFKRQRMS